MLYILMAVVFMAALGGLFADSTKDGGALHLYDNWPGPITEYKTLAGFYSAATHNIAAEDTFSRGDKACIRNPGTSLGIEGVSIFTYLQVVANAGVAIAAKSVCVLDVTLYPYRVTNDPDSCVSVADGLCAVALSAMTTLYWGWFWTGGVCPSDLIVAMDGTFGTDDSLVAGDFTTVDLTDDAIGFGVIAATTSAVGYADAAD